MGEVNSGAVTDGLEMEQVRSEGNEGGVTLRDRASRRASLTDCFEALLSFSLSLSLSVSLSLLLSLPQQMHCITYVNGRSSGTTSKACRQGLECSGPNSGWVTPVAGERERLL